MINTISNHLQASLLQKGLITLQSHSVDVHQLVHDSLRNNLIAARLKSINFEISIIPSPLIKGDYFRLIEVLDQLIQNAIYFSPEGKSIHVEVYRNYGMVCIAITDQGRGFLPIERDRLFNRYVRLRSEATTNQKEDTAGLGLAICKRIIELHSGKIWAVSPGPDKGATFTIELPI